ncbi:MAG: hypothetical protein QOG27_1816, partial [Verrucomicrobiota bacterium]
FVRVRKMMADIAFADCAEQRIGNGVTKDVRIRMALEAAFEWNLNPAEDQLPIRGEPMSVVTISTPDHL